MAGGRKLAANVYVDGVLYESGSTPPADVAEAITNPKAWGKSVEDSSSSSGQGFPDGAPSEEWKAEELKAYAKANSIDLGSASKKAEMVEAIEAAQSAS